MNQYTPMPGWYAPGYQPQYVPSYQPPAQVQTSTRPVSPITGRVVSSPDEITVQEVPTDGSIAWFPAQDGSCVYGKRWTPDGSITTLRYVPEEGGAERQRDRIDVLGDRIDELRDMVEDMSERLPRRRARKADDDA